MGILKSYQVNCEVLHQIENCEPFSFSSNVYLTLISVILFKSFN